MVRELSSALLPDEAEADLEDMFEAGFEDLEADLDEMLDEESDLEPESEEDGPVDGEGGPEEPPPDDPEDPEAPSEPSEEDPEMEDPEEPDEPGEPAPDGTFVSNESDPCQASMLDQIRDAEARCKEAELNVLAAKQDLKEAKATFDSRIAKLRQLVSSLTNDDGRPLIPIFDSAENGRREAVATSVEEASPDEVKLSEEEEYDRLLDVPLEDLNLPNAAFGKLVDKGIETVKDLEELQTEISTGKAEWPKGIGPATVTKIEDAIVDWLATNLETEDDATTEDEEEE